MIAIIADSTASIPCREALDLGVLIAPISCMGPGQSFQEGCLEANGAFSGVDLASRNGWTTSHTSVTQFSEMFRELTREGHEVLCLVISSRLSGTYSSALSAARETAPDRIAVVDSLVTAGGLKLLAGVASGMRKSGATLGEMAQALAEKRSQVGVAFSVDDMASLRSSGRLGAVRQSVGTVLNVRPVLTLEAGAIVSRGASRGRGQTLRALVSLIPAEARAVIVHHGGASGPEPLLNLLRQSHPGAEVYACGVSFSLRIHLGAGIIGAAWIT